MIRHLADAEQAANLFGCEPRVLMDTLCTRSVESGKDKVITRLSPANVRDTLYDPSYDSVYLYFALYKTFNMVCCLVVIILSYLALLDYHDCNI